MAKPKMNFVIEKVKNYHNLIRVWTPAPTEAKELIEAIGGVVSTHHSKEIGYLNVWLNPCYDKAEIMAEIKEGIDATAN